MESPTRSFYCVCQYLSHDVTQYIFVTRDHFTFPFKALLACNLPKIELYVLVEASWNCVHMYSQSVHVTIRREAVLVVIPLGLDRFLSEDLGLKDIRPVRRFAMLSFPVPFPFVLPLPIHECIDHLSLPLSLSLPPPSLSCSPPPRSHNVCHTIQHGATRFTPL